MKHKRILLLGPTGITKRAVLDKVGKSVSQKLGGEIHRLDFEKDYLPQASTWSSWPGFLFSNSNYQSTTWQQGWAKCKEAIRQRPSEQCIVLSMHGVYAIGDGGVRSLVDVDSVCRDFAPTLIVTLIDDVYDMWRRTEKRAGGVALKGRPTLEQLIEARRSETLIGQLISCQPSLSRPARHILLSVHHPVEILRDLIVFDSEIVYLSFPISAPRELLRDEGNSDFINAINAFHRRVLARFRVQEQPKRVFISPLAIDELPLCSAIAQADEHARKSMDAAAYEKALAAGELTVQFDPSTSRWSLRDLWGDVELLSETRPEAIPLSLKQGLDVSGLLQTDVGWRDYKLVRQAKALGVYCPVGPKRERIARGVSAEIQAAVQIGDILIYIWQNPKWDQQNLVAAFKGTPGSMGVDSTQLRTNLVLNEDDLVEQILTP